MVQARESLAFDSLHRDFREPLLRFFARRLPGDAAAEDMVQQVFERLVQRGGFDSIENAKGYVYRVAENVFADHMRRAAVRRSHAHDQFDESLHAGVDFSPEHVLAKKERLARAMEILQALRSEEHTSELQSLMRISYAVFCLKKKKLQYTQNRYDKQ